MSSAKIVMKSPSRFASFLNILLWLGSYRPTSRIVRLVHKHKVGSSATHDHEQ